LKVSKSLFSSFSQLKEQRLKVGRAEVRKCSARIAKRLLPPTLPQSVTRMHYWRLTNRETREEIVLSAIRAVIRFPGPAPQHVQRTSSRARYPERQALIDDRVFFFGDTTIRHARILFVLSLWG